MWCPLTLSVSSFNSVEPNHSPMATNLPVSTVTFSTPQWEVRHPIITIKIVMVPTIFTNLVALTISIKMEIETLRDNEIKHLHQLPSSPIMAIVLELIAASVHIKMWWGTITKTNKNHLNSRIIILLAMVMVIAISRSLWSISKNLRDALDAIIMVPMSKLRLAVWRTMLVVHRKINMRVISSTMMAGKRLRPIRHAN